MNASVRCTRAGTPDQVPLLLDLSHWYKKNRNVFFNLAGFTEVEQGLVDLHRQVGAVCYCEMGGFYSLSTDDPEVKLESRTEHGVFSTRITTPLGTIHEERVFNPASYSYGIRKYLLAIARTSSPSSSSSWSGCVAGPSGTCTGPGRRASASWPIPTPSCRIRGRAT